MCFGFLDLFKPLGMAALKFQLHIACVGTICVMEKNGEWHDMAVIIRVKSTKRGSERECACVAVLNIFCVLLCSVCVLRGSRDMKKTQQQHQGQGC